MAKRRRRQFRAIDLFCGCGGLTLGLRRAGFRVVAGIDSDSLSIATHAMNHKGTRLVEEDIGAVRPHELRADLGLATGELDLLAGCPPCQGFSRLRTKNGKRGIVDPLNDLLFQFVRFVREFVPKAVMLENVPALATNWRMQVLQDELCAVGYESDLKVLDAQSFGVPQRRLRMILLAGRGECPPFASEVRKGRTVAGAIRRLPRPEDSDDPTHNYVVRRAPRVAELIRRVPKDGGSRTDLPASAQLRCHRESDGFRDIYGRMAWSEPAPTITGGCINPSKGRYVHPMEDRAITVREAALLQSFPRQYQLDMSRGRYPAAQLIGNAFPPKFAEHHARAIHRHLRRRLEG